jgi:hypothetical protein
MKKKIRKIIRNLCNWSVLILKFKTFDTNKHYSSTVATLIDVPQLKNKGNYTQPVLLVNFLELDCAGLLFAKSLTVIQELGDKPARSANYSLYLSKKNKGNYTQPVYHDSLKTRQRKPVA